LTLTRLGRLQILVLQCKIHDKEFTLDDFSHERIKPLYIIASDKACDGFDFQEALNMTIRYLNIARAMYIETKDKEYWWQMIQLLPSSYNQLRTVQLNYEVLYNIYFARRDHKLDEWIYFCLEITKLPLMPDFLNGR